MQIFPVDKPFRIEAPPKISPSKRTFQKYKPQDLFLEFYVIYVYECLNGVGEYDFDSKRRISSNVLEIKINTGLTLYMCRGRTTFRNVWVSMCHHLDSLHVVQLKFVTLYSNSLPILELPFFSSYSGNLHCPAETKVY